MELTQIRLMVSDFPAVYRFYRDVLGLKPQFEAGSGPYAKLSPDTGHAAIACRTGRRWAACWGDWGRSRRDTARWWCCGWTTSTPPMPISLRGGAQFTRDPGPMGDRIRVAYLEDPEGNLIELQEWLAPLEQAGTGRA